MESIQPVLTNGMNPFDVSGGLEQAKNNFFLDPLSNNPELGTGWRAGAMSSAVEQPLTLSTSEPGNPNLEFDVYNFPESYGSTLGAKASNLSSETGVFTVSGTSDYLLFGGISIATVVPDPGNTLGTAYNVGTLNGSRTFTDFVGSTDTSDIYRFSLSGTSNFNLSLTGLSNDADVRLIQDINGNGIIDSNDEIVRSAWGDTHDESIHRSLTAGTYFVEVYQYLGDTNYTLNLSTNQPSNLLPTETDIGTLTGTRTFTDFVGSTDTADTYRFSLSGTSNFNLSLTGLTNDADVRLIQDINGNGIIDSNEEIVRSSWGSTYDESINRSLTAGTYFVQVYQYLGDTNYTLNLSTAQPSNLLPTETNIGTLSGTRTFSGSISNTNISDIYRFSLNATSNLSLTLSGLSNDADVRLIRDANNNGIIDSGEEIRGSFSGSNYSEGINSSLGAGNYFVQVYQHSGSTNYNLSLSTGDWYSQNLLDPGIIGQARTYAANGQLSRNAMMAILRDTEDGGVVDGTELTDLRKLVSDRSSLMPGHVYNLSNKIINGNLANGNSGIGNLFAGSSSTQMERLIGKWFLGNDRPTANGTYQFVNGSLFVRGSLLENAIRYQDVNQGSTGDCYLMSGLAEIALRTPNAISSMFIDNGDNTYTVRFFNNGVADYVTVDRYLPTSGGNAIYAGWGGGSNTSSTNELWVALAEKAYAQINQSEWLGRDNDTNSYAAIAGGNSYDTIRQITGRNTEGRDLPGTSLFGIPIERGIIISTFNAGQLVTLGTNDFGLTNSSVVADHEYALIGYNSSTQRFMLFNPWGVNGGWGNDGQFKPGIIELTWSDLAANFGYWNRTTA